MCRSSVEPRPRAELRQIRSGSAREKRVGVAQLCHPLWLGSTAALEGGVGRCDRTGLRRPGAYGRNMATRFLGAGHTVYGETRHGGEVQNLEREGCSGAIR